MAVNPGAATVCLVIQQALQDISRGNVPTLKITNPGTLQALTSEANKGGFTTVESNDPRGRDTAVRVEYWQNPRAAAATTRPDICTPGTQTTKLYADVSTNMNRSVSLTLDEPTFRTFCNDANADKLSQSPFAQQLTTGVLNQLLDGIDQDAVTYALSQAGNFYNAIPGPKDVTMIKSDGSVYFGGETDIITDMEDLDNFAKPFAIGAGYLRTYSKYADTNVLCCDQTGFNLSDAAASSFVYFFDRKVPATAVAANRFLLLYPGALQIIPNNRWVGPFDDFVNGTAKDDQAKTTMILPVPGGGDIRVDFTVYRSFCGDDNNGDTSWLLTWNLRFGFFNIPPDVEAVGSPYSGVNNIFQYNAVCGDITCADVES